MSFLPYNRRRHCTIRRRVHDVNGCTPTHIQHILVVRHNIFSFWQNCSGGGFLCIILAIMQRPAATV